MEVQQFKASGILVYNKVAAKGESQRGQWKRSEVVIETTRANGDTACKVYSLWGECEINVGASVDATYALEEIKYTDKSGNERKYFTPRIIEITETKKEVPDGFPF